MKIMCKGQYVSSFLKIPFVYPLRLGGGEGDHACLVQKEDIAIKDRISPLPLRPITKQKLASLV